VLVAEDAELGRRVALKRILPEAADASAARARFVREAEVTGSLEHPGVVPVYGMGRDADGRPYYAMRFITGRSLKDAVHEFHTTPFADEGRRTVAFRKLLGCFVSVCQTMAFAHSRGVVHRDLKPANVMVGEFGETLVVDWGLAKLVDGTATTAGATAPATAAPAGPARADDPPTEPSPRPGPGSSTAPDAAVPPDPDDSRTHAVVEPTPISKGSSAVTDALEPRPAADDRDSTVPMWPQPRPGLADEGRPGRDAGRPRAAAGRPEVRGADRAPGDGFLPPTAEGLSLGTPGFMSPEQARGQNAAVTAASDVYSLGATLYAVITGRSPLDHVPPNSMLLFTALGKVPRPRELNPAAPAALEAVVLKAMALDPVDRYAGASALAADVEAWLADEPVSAWREPLPVRVGRWVRRNRAAVSSAVAALAAVSVALAGGLAVVEGQRRDLADLNGRLDAALADARAQRDEARAARDEAVAARVRAESAETAERQARGEAVAERRRAVDNFRRADGSVDGLFDAVRDSRELFDDPRLAGLRERLMGKVLDYSRAVRGQSAGDDIGFKSALASSALRVGRVLAEMGRESEAIDALRSAIRDFAPLAEAHPDDEPLAGALAKAHLSLGIRLHKTDDLEGSERAYRAAAAVAERFAATPVPADPAAASLRAELLNGVAAAEGNLANVRLEVGRDPVSAEGLFRSSIRRYERLVEMFPDRAEFRAGAARMRANLAVALRRMPGGDPAAAEEGKRLQTDAVADLRRIVEAHPGNADYRTDLASANAKLGTTLAAAGDRAGAEAAFNAALAEYGKLAADRPDRPEYRERLAYAHGGLGALLMRSGDPAGSAERYRAAVALRRRLAEEHPERIDHRENLGRSLGHLGFALSRLGDHAGAAESHRSASDEFRRLADGPGRQRRIEFLVLLGGSLCNQANAQVRVDPAPAPAAYGGAIAALEEALWLRPDAPDAARFRVNSLLGRAATYGEMGRHAEAAADWDRLAASSEPDAAAHCRRMAALARASAAAAGGDHAAASAALAAGAEGGRPAMEDYAAARVASLGSAAAAADARLPADRRAAETERLAKAAVDRLRTAAKGRFVDFFAVLRDRAFDPLRDREDFRAVIAAWKAAGGDGPSPKPAGAGETGKRPERSPDR
jgi:serine/threonine protein kinase